MCAVLHPSHGPVVPGLKPMLEIDPCIFHRIGTRETTSHEAQPLSFDPYCFFKAFVVSHDAQLTPFGHFLQEFECFIRPITVQ